MLVKRVASVWLVLLIVGWSCCYTYGQGLSIRSLSPEAPLEGILFQVRCEAVIPSPAGTVTIVFDTPETFAGFGGLVTNFDGVDTYDSTLFFPSPTVADDTGVYTCRAEVDGMTQKSGSFAINFDADVRLFLVPTIDQDPEIATVGVDYVLTCRLDTFQSESGQVTFIWEDPDGTPFTQEDTRFVTALPNNDNTTLEFRPPQEFHAGEYKCTVVIGSVNVPTTALVQVNLPAITLSIISNDAPILGEDFGFMCEVVIDNDINESISYSFLHNNITNSSTGPFVNIDTLRLSDTGVYLCSVVIDSPYINNNISLVTSEEDQLVINLTIPSPAVTTASDPPNPLPHLSFTSLTCNVTLDPLVDVEVELLVEWVGPAGVSQVDTVTLQAEESFYMSTLELTDLVFGVNDGSYNCSVAVTSNQLQEFIMDSETVSSTVTIEIIPLVVPSPPVISNTSLDSRRLDLQWTQQDTDFIEEYTVTVTATPLGCEALIEDRVSTLGGLNRSLLVEELEEFSNITVVLVARNKLGNATTAVVVTTMSAAPGGMPEDLNITSSDAMNIQISWSPVPCLQTNSEITGYTVTYGRTLENTAPAKRQATLEQLVEEIEGTGPESRQFTAGGLLPRTSYTFSVRALNGDGEESPAAVFETSTGIPEFVGLQNSGQLIPNNSIVNTEDIGVDLDSVLCFTDLEDCCAAPENMELGQWLLPDGTVVTDVMDNVLFETRQGSVVGLNRGMGNGNVTSGLYRCEMQDSAGRNETVFLGVYSATEGSPELVRFYHDVDTGELVCMSTGGPATSVSWQRNGVDISGSFPNFQHVSSTLDAEYRNVLQLDGAPEMVIGDYTCQVTNSRGSSEVLTVQLLGLQVSGALSYNAGDEASLSCFTDLQFTSITWTDSSGMVLATSTSSRELFLNFTAMLNQVEFLCQIESEVGDQMRVVTIAINPTTGGVTPNAGLTDAQRNGAIIGGVLGGVLLLVIVALIILFCCCCLGARRHGSFKLEKSHPAQYEMNVYMPSAADDENEQPYENGDLSSSQAPLTEAEEGYRRMEDGNGGVEESPNSIVNTEAIYENSTFRARDREEPIPVSEFEAQVEQLHMGKNFDTEYMLISRSPHSSYSIASIPHNKIRNRFGNIFPYDDNRVILKTIPSVKGSDYINASFIDGYKKEKMYIAAQGPNPESLSDFWRMIWEYKIPTIAMLTRCYEGGKKKCEQYYPEKLETPMFPGQNLSVSLVAVTPYANYTVRRMSVRNTAEPDTPPFEVVQFHFLGWPDHGVPTNSTTLINFIKQVRKSHPFSSKDYLLVHCSAGVGRTGTFITLDCMLERIRAEKTINIFPFVKQLRTERVLMVQTLVQYVFIFDALNEYLICGETEIPARRLREKYKKMSELVPLLLPVGEDDVDGNLEKEEDGETTEFEQQFLLLNHLTQVEQDTKCGHAKAPVNKVKNRYSGRIPNYFTRVRLRPTAEEGSDYINASFIDGYRGTQAFIATQGPLENTIDDFWKMIYEYRSKCIVMLCDLTEDGKEASQQYWPNGTFSPEKYGKITVNKTADDRYQDYVVRKFEVTGVPPKSLSANNSNLSPSFVVTQFHYMNWRENVVPEDTRPMIEMLNKILKVQSATGNKSITVICNNGVGRTGSFLGIYSQLERLKSEGEIDIFQFVKAARIQRAGLIVNHEQYTFCHEVLADYVDTLQEYTKDES